MNEFKKCWFELMQLIELVSDDELREKMKKAHEGEIDGLINEFGEDA